MIALTPELPPWAPTFNHHRSAVIGSRISRKIRGALTGPSAAVGGTREFFASWRGRMEAPEKCVKALQNTGKEIQIKILIGVGFILQGRPEDL